jgi:hypothetical protein
LRPDAFSDVGGLELLQKNRAEMRLDLIPAKEAVSLSLQRLDRAKLHPSLDSIGDVLADGHQRARDMSALADCGDQLGELQLRRALAASKGVILGDALASASLPTSIFNCQPEPCARMWPFMTLFPC